MNLNWIGSHSYPRSHNVVDHPYSHFKASDRAGNDGRSGHDLDLHGHERDAKQALKQSYCILSQSECAQLTNHSVGRPMYYIDEASGGLLRERDSQVMRFHSSHYGIPLFTHSSPNLWFHWKWIEWNLACLKR